METEVRVPAVGESITSGVLSAWQKQDGELVRAGEALFVLETDKVSTEVPAMREGTLRIQVPEGAEVRIGEVVGVIQESAEAPAEPRNEPGQPGQLGQPGPIGAIGPMSPETTALPPPLPPPPAPASEPKQEEPVAVAREARVTRRRLSPLRRKIASQLVMAQHAAAMLTTFNECDMGPVLELRARAQEAFQKQHGVKLGLMSIFLKAAVAALKAVPQINARLEGEDLIQNHFFDLGVAVGTERGLIVPVIRDADQKSFAELEREILQFAGRAREGKIKLEELQGGVFTISNGGVYGSMLSTPILNAPQSAILGLHKIQDRPMAVAGQVAIRPMMYLALSYDHRVVDGKEAVTFLVKIKDSIEDPMRLMLEL
jgi:2-oxoglutarate dehydrogenase E2 component (dihydrolipoamide succinyltransferase)